MSEFVKGTQRLVNPIDVGSMHFIQWLNRMLPKPIQDALVKSSGKKYPYMGFVVEPYSYFMFYEITDLDMAQSLLPDGFKPIKTKIFDTDEPKYYVIFGCFRAHTSAFWGARIEFYVVAEDQQTGLLTWVIVDYDSDTISHDPKRGLYSPNCVGGVMTTDYDGTLTVDFKRNDNSRQLVFEGDLTKGTQRELDQRLWLEGNLSVCHGKELSNGKADVFSLRFEPEEVEQALDMPLDSLQMQTNSWYPGLFAKEPSAVVCFPYAQHFVSDSPGHASNIKNRDELIAANKSLDFNKIELFSTESFKVIMFAGTIFSFAISTILLLLLIFT
ncbi:hypothetical protein KC614_03120 [candidate division WWE3 bacterium]|uniref:Uncharacterized protein n=1 Tax=candidate division WWE3 bacterium TaxID=2053526 RepID=A0A955RS32_UNCKA|nr:hypothetical protein [candidate division WWE3 bacterium]